MEKYHNESYERIFNYIANNQQLEPDKKRNLIRYATLLYLNKIENSKKVNLKDYLLDLKKVYKYLGESSLNSITRERVMRLYLFLKICDQHSKGIKKIDEELLEKLSYKLDMLFLDAGLPPREKSALSYTLQKEKMLEVNNEKIR